MTDDEIETTAKRIVQGLGLDPEERVGMGVDDTWTPAEAAGKTFVPLVLLIQPRWVMYRRQAAEALAVKEALA